MPGEERKKIVPGGLAAVFIIVVPIVILDQLTKLLVINNLKLYQSVPVIQNIFYITFIANKGAAFGMFKNQVPLFVLAALIAIALIFSGIKNNRHKRAGIYDIALIFILAGAIGNLIDRLRLGYVIDFLDFRIWPVFNIADSAITAGAVLLGYTIIFSKSKNY